MGERQAQRWRKAESLAAMMPERVDELRGPRLAPGEESA